MTTRDVRNAAERILAEMGGNAEEICNGDCPVFAMKLVDAVGGQIVSNLQNAMVDDLEGYEVIAPDERWPNPNRSFHMSHCWVKVGKMYYDAFNPEGVDNEHLLEFYQNNA